MTKRVKGFELSAAERVDILTKRIDKLRDGAGIYSDENRAWAIYSAEHALSEAQDDLEAEGAK